MRINKKIASLAVGAAVVAVTGIASAYWTTTGSGTGTAETAADSPMTLHGVMTAGDIADLTPGGPGAEVSFTVDNPSSGHQYVGTVTLDSVDAYASAAHRTAGTPKINGTGAGQCDTSQFSMTPVVQNQDVGPGNGTALDDEGTLVLANAAVSQDGCKNAFLTLNLSHN